MRKRRIERALLLGLVLSTSIYGTSFAAEQTVDEFVQDATGEITVAENTTVTGDGTQSGDTDTIGNGLYTKVDNEWINNKVIVVGNSKLVFNDVALNNATITGDGKIIINNTLNNNGEPGKGMPAGLYLTGSVEADTLEIKNTSNGGKGIHAYNTGRGSVNDGNVTVNVQKDMIVKSNSDGIFTEADVNGLSGQNNSIDITAANLTVETESRGGIYNNGVGTENNHIRINVGDGTVSVNSGDDTGKYGGIINKNLGDTTIKAGAINVTADGSNGVYATAGDINLEAKLQNVITAGTNGIYVSGEGSTVTLNSKINNIIVNNTNTNESGNTDATGIRIENKGSFNLSKEDGFENESTTINASSQNGNATGIYVNNSTVNTDPAIGNLTINATSQIGTSNGIQLDDNGNFTADVNTLTINTTGKQNSTGIGISTGGELNIISENGIEISSKTIDPNNNSQVNASAGISAMTSVVNLTTNTGDIIINKINNNEDNTIENISDLNYSGVGINSQMGSSINLKAQNNIEINGITGVSISAANITPGESYVVPRAR